MMDGLTLLGLAVFAVLVLSRLRDIISGQEAIMAAIDDAATAVNEKVSMLTAKVDETIVTLQELKALIGSGSTANAEAILAEVGTKIDATLSNLTAAETDADPTPDA